MRISDWSSDVCSSDLAQAAPAARPAQVQAGDAEEDEDDGGGADDLFSNLVGDQPTVQLHGDAEEFLVARLRKDLAVIGIDMHALAAATAVLGRKADIGAVARIGRQLQRGDRVVRPLRAHAL